MEIGEHQFENRALWELREGKLVSSWKLEYHVAWRVATWFLPSYVLFWDETLILPAFRVEVDVFSWMGLWLIHNQYSAQEKWHHITSETRPKEEIWLPPCLLGHDVKSPEPPCEKSSSPEATMLWGSPGHMGRILVGALFDSGQHQQRTCDRKHLHMILAPSCWVTPGH